MTHLPDFMFHLKVWVADPDMAEEIMQGDPHRRASCCTC